jgi:hypothetical protein
MTFGGQMKHHVGHEAGKNSRHVWLIGNVQLLKLISGCTAERGNGPEIARIGQLIDVEHMMACLDQMSDDGRSDEPATSRNQSPHAINSTSIHIAKRCDGEMLAPPERPFGPIPGSRTFADMIDCMLAFCREPLIRGAIGYLLPR